MGSVVDLGENPAIVPSPSSLVIDFGPLQQRNKREILGNILNFPPPPATCVNHDVLP